MIDKTPDLLVQIVENQAEIGGLRDFSLEKTKNTSKFDIERMSQEELLLLHSKIEQRITGVKLSDINLEKETLIQFQKAKLLQEKAGESKDVPVNQLAQVQNSIRTILESLAKMQMEIHNSEAIKRLKAAIVKIMKTQSKEVQDAFFDMLENEVGLIEQTLSE